MPWNLSPAPLSLFKLETSSESFFNSLASELSALEDVNGLREKKKSVMGGWGDSLVGKLSATQA